MSSQSQKPKNKPAAKNSGSKTIHENPKRNKVRNDASVAHKGFWEILDSFFVKRLNLVLGVSVALTIVLGAFLFDVKISTGGDDSHYVEMANDFLKGRSFPSWHGPLYPIFLSLPILIFGVNIIWLKIFSFIFIVAQLILFYYTFRRHLSPAIFSLVMLIIAVDSVILYFASQTYSEAMFMFLQSLAVYIFITIYLNTKDKNAFTFKQEAVQWLILGFFVFLSSLTRNIGIVMLVSMVLFLVLEKRFRASAMLFVSYIVFLIPFRIYKSFVWDTSLSQKPDQISEILSKNPYNKAMGTEDFAGMVDRFFLNAYTYISKHFMIGVGLHDPYSTEKSWVITILIAILLIVTLFYAFRRNKVILFTVIYLGGSMAATFIALNQSWDQMRMVVIYIPMLILSLAWGIQQIASGNRLKFLNVVLLVLLVVIFFKTFSQTSDKIKVNHKILSKNLKGNLYYGFTPDWQNYLRMSEWVGKNIPENEKVASRKPSNSYIYSGGREFYGMYRFPSEVPEEFIGQLKKRTGELLVIPNRSINQQWPASLQWSIKKANVGCVAEGSEIFGVYEFKGSEGNEAVQSLYQLNVRPFTADSLLKRVKASKLNCFAVSPDTLVSNLKKNEVQYVIVASLRANPNMKTENIINNIQRYLYFIEQKYPGILSLVHQIGADNEEPAWLYKINYPLFGL